MHAQSAADAPLEIAVAVVERDGSFLIGLRPAGAADSVDCSDYAP